MCVCASEYNREPKDSLPTGSLGTGDESISNMAWAYAIRSVSEPIMKFGLNAVTDTLPHFCNLKKWKKVNTDRCPLCDERQTLLHVLNHCQKVLTLRRFTNRHNAVLEVISKLVKDYLPSSYEFAVDLSDCYKFPEHVCDSEDLRPDIVIWSDSEEDLLLFELTVCFETNIVAAATRKADRYAQLATNARAKGYKCNVYPIQVGSRGYVDMDSFEPLRKFLKVKTKQYLPFLTQLISKYSYMIWKSRNTVN